MKAIRIEETGGPEVLQWEDVAPVEEPGPGEAVVRVVAAGVNFMDVQQRSGRYPVQLPFTPGVEAAGVVESVGEGVTGVKPGDRVAYAGQPGAYAEASAVRADRLIPLSDAFSFEEGAAFPLQGITAHYLIHEFRPIKKGDIVLVHAAAGGVGLLLTQWARHLGARVIGTVSNEEKARIALEAGLHDVIVYTRLDFVTEIKRLTAGHGADLIFDAVGKTTFTGDLQAAATRGHIVVFGATERAGRAGVAEHADGARADAVGRQPGELRGDARGNHAARERSAGRAARRLAQAAHRSRAAVLTGGRSAPAAREPGNVRENRADERDAGRVDCDCCTRGGNCCARLRWWMLRRKASTSDQKAQTRKASGRPRKFSRRWARAMRGTT